jgi:hypothetical protein
MDAPSFGGGDARLLAQLAADTTTLRIHADDDIRPRDRRKTASSRTPHEARTLSPSSFTLSVRGKDRSD